MLRMSLSRSIRNNTNFRFLFLMFTVYPIQQIHDAGCQQNPELLFRLTSATNLPGRIQNYKLVSGDLRDSNYDSIDLIIQISSLIIIGKSVIMHIDQGRNKNVELKTNMRICYRNKRRGNESPRQT